MRFTVSHVNELQCKFKSKSNLFFSSFMASITSLTIKIIVLLKKL
ncbi:uncharacterized protein METZ01_LOCUS304720 [marine metagenome]|uniref:Uncharacterized protein n=1 Tax=marine metagenome TaxID=408172 RepID=A0A382MT06_9ZZZZ